MDLLSDVRDLINEKPAGSRRCVVRLRSRSSSVHRQIWPAHGLSRSRSVSFSKFDKNNTVAVGPGGVIHDIPNQMHYDGTGPEGATLEFIAMGPAARN